MIWYRGSSILIATLVCACLFYSLHHSQALAGKQAYYRLTLDPTFSTQLREDITEFIHRTNNVDPHDLKKRFPSIQNLTIEKRIPNINKVCADSATPLCLVNHEVVIDQQGNIHSPANFSPEVVQALPTILTKKTNHIFDQVPMELISFVTSLPLEMLDRFTVVWIDKTKVYFLNRKNNQFAMATRFDQCPSRPDVEMCEHLFEQQPPERYKVRGTRLVVDVRFKGQVVIYPKRGSLLNDV